jgi:hypothetical protein
MQENQPKKSKKKEWTIETLPYDKEIVQANAVAGLQCFAKSAKRLNQDKFKTKNVE